MGPSLNANYPHSRMLTTILVLTWHVNMYLQLLLDSAPHCPFAEHNVTFTVQSHCFAVKPTHWETADRQNTYQATWQLHVRSGRCQVPPRRSGCPLVCRWTATQSAAAGSWVTGRTAARCDLWWECLLPLCHTAADRLGPASAAVSNYQKRQSLHMFLMIPYLTLGKQSWFAASSDKQHSLTHCIIQHSLATNQCVYMYMLMYSLSVYSQLLLNYCHCTQWIYPAYLGSGADFLKVRFPPHHRHTLMRW